MKMTDVTSSKHCIHFRRSVFCPPTSVILRVEPNPPRKKGGLVNKARERRRGGAGQGTALGLQEVTRGWWESAPECKIGILGVEHVLVHPLCRDSGVQNVRVRRCETGVAYPR